MMTSLKCLFACIFLMTGVRASYHNHKRFQATRSAPPPSPPSSSEQAASAFVEGSSVRFATSAEDVKEDVKGPQAVKDVKEDVKGPQAVKDVREDVKGPQAVKEPPAVVAESGTSFSDLSRKNASLPLSKQNGFTNILKEEGHMPPDMVHHLAAALWDPFLQTAINSFIGSAAGARIGSNMFLRNLVKVNAIDLGNTAPELLRTSLYQYTDNDCELKDEALCDSKLVMFRTIRFAPAAKLNVAILGAVLDIKEFVLEGELMIEFTPPPKPYTSFNPIGAVKVSFLDQPKVSLDLGGVAGQIAANLAYSTIVDTIGSLIAGKLVLPNRIAIPMSNEIDRKTLKSNRPIMRVHVNIKLAKKFSPPGGSAVYDIGNVVARVMMGGEILATERDMGAGSLQASFLVYDPHQKVTIQYWAKPQPSRLAKIRDYAAKAVGTIYERAGEFLISSDEFLGGAEFPVDKLIMGTGEVTASWDGLKSTSRHLVNKEGEFSDAIEHAFSMNIEDGQEALIMVAVSKCVMPQKFATDDGLTLQVKIAGKSGEQVQTSGVKTVSGGWYGAQTREKDLFTERVFARMLSEKIPYQTIGRYLEMSDLEAARWEKRVKGSPGGAPGRAGSRTLDFDQEFYFPVGEGPHTVSIQLMDKDGKDFKVSFDEAEKAEPQLGYQETMYTMTHELVHCVLYGDVLHYEPQVSSFGRDTYPKDYNLGKLNIKSLMD